MPPEYSSGDYYAAKDAEDANGRVHWEQVPKRFGGTLNTGHPEDQDDD